MFMALTESRGAASEQGGRRTKMEPGEARKGTGGLEAEIHQKRQRGEAELLRIKSIFRA